jgi:hypothetical protein
VLSPRRLTAHPNVNVQFLVTFVISLMKAIDIRSESAIKLLAEFLDMDAPYVPGERHVNAEHFAHGPFTPFSHTMVSTSRSIFSRDILLFALAV